MDAILKERLGITYPRSDVIVMTEGQRLTNYGADGVLNTYQHLINSSYGVQSKKIDEKKAQLKMLKITDKKTKAHSAAQNTPAEDNAIQRYDSNADPHIIPLPSNQLARKRPRAASSEISRDSPHFKKGKQQDPPAELDDELDNVTAGVGSLKKGKSRVIESNSNSDDDMDVEVEDALEKSLSPEADLDN